MARGIRKQLRHLKNDQRSASRQQRIAGNKKFKRIMRSRDPLVSATGKLGKLQRREQGMQQYQENVQQRIQAKQQYADLRSSKWDFRQMRALRQEIRKCLLNESKTRKEIEALKKDKVKVDMGLGELTTKLPSITAQRKDLQAKERALQQRLSSRGIQVQRRKGARG